MIDCIASEVQYVDHLAPVWRALGAEAGEFIVTSDAARDRSSALGIEPVIEPTGHRPVLVASRTDHKHARSLRRRSIARMEHGIGQSFRASTNPSYAGGSDAHDIGLFLTPNEHSADRWRRAYPRTPVAVVGSPRLDTLLHREPGPGPVIATSFHWGHPGRRENPVNESRGSWAEYRDAVLALPGAVIGTGHPKAIDAMDYGPIPVVGYDEVFRRADVLVCDTNSALYEFASTGRPVVVVNGSHFRRGEEHGLRFWEAATVGVQCDHPDDLVAAVARALECRPDDVARRERALDIVYAYRTGAAGRAAFSLLDTVIPIPR